MVLNVGVCAQEVCVLPSRSWLVGDGWKYRIDTDADAPDTPDTSMHGTNRRASVSISTVYTPCLVAPWYAMQWDAMGCVE